MHCLPNGSGKGRCLHWDTRIVEKHYFWCLSSPMGTIEHVNLQWNTNKRTFPLPN
ncbi:hypothetical protein T05_6738, partial [Trichinella murrelli]